MTNEEESVMRTKSAALLTTAPVTPITATASDEIAYDEAVRRGKEIIATVSGKQWELGDLATQVTKKWGENRLEQFAKDINFSGAPCTLGRYRSVCLAFPKTGGRPLFFGSAQKLQKHPDRIKIVTENPDLSKAEAIELMRKWRAEQNGTAGQGDEDEDDEVEEGEGDTKLKATPPPAKTKGAKAKATKKPVNADQADLNESKRLLAKHLQQANDMLATSEARKRCPPEQARNLGKAAAMFPATLQTMEQAKAEYSEYVAWLKKLAAKAKATAVREGRIKTSPEPAASSTPAQVAA
jgi:hypothetical protein